MAMPQTLQWLGPGEIADSTNVAGIAHDQLTGNLYVRFHNGSMYRYGGIDAQVFGNMVHSSSVGKFLNDYIKPFASDYERI